jgi:soluble lytic murein transglycosylase
LLVLVTGAVVLAGLGFGYWRTIRYDSLIDQFSRKYQLDFYLVKALIHEESRFSPRARGSKGEMGLMQIMPGTGYDFWERHGRAGVYEPTWLLEPEHNLEVGCWYLRDSLNLYRETADPVICALARYNAGQTRVARWITAADLHDARIIDHIDFPKTREYVLRVIERSQRRSQIYLW